MKARVIMDYHASFKNGQYTARVTVLEVTRRPKFPDGIKTKCLLIETETGTLHVLLDNHEPYGYHLHTKLPHDKNFRTSLSIKNHLEAIDIFMSEVQKVVENDK